MSLTRYLELAPLLLLHGQFGASTFTAALNTSSLQIPFNYDPRSLTRHSELAPLLLNNSAIHGQAFYCTTRIDAFLAVLTS